MNEKCTRNEEMKEENEDVLCLHVVDRCIDRMVPTKVQVVRAVVGYCLLSTVQPAVTIRHKDQIPLTSDGQAAVIVVDV